MEYKHLGRTGLKVSRLCLGTMNFGPLTTEQDSHAIMDKALDCGINFIDTANIYGWKTGEGWTEQIIGNWFAKGGRRREKVVIATKLFNMMGDWPNESRLSALHIRRACDESLQRLKTDHIDLYQMHNLDPESPWDEIWQAMEQLVQAGKVIYVGSSKFPAWNIVQANEAAGKRNFLGLVSEQCKYNLITRAVEREVLPACKAYGLGVIPFSPLGGGLLGGILHKESQGRRAEEDMQEELAKRRPQIEAYEGLCAEIGAKPGDVALAWVLSNPIVTAPIIGPRIMDQLDSAIGALELKLSQETLKKLDEIFPLV